jgi:hypothetical protein
LICLNAAARIVRGRATATPAISDFEPDGIRQGETKNEYPLSPARVELGTRLVVDRTGIRIHEGVSTASRTVCEVGRVEGTGCGAMLLLRTAYSFIPVMLNERVENACAEVFAKALA